MDRWRFDRRRCRGFRRGLICAAMAGGACSRRQGGREIGEAGNEAEEGDGVLGGGWSSMTRSFERLWMMATFSRSGPL